MEAAVQQVHESCSAAVLDGTGIVYVLRVPTQKIMAINLSIGSRLPAYCTSMGRVLLAGLDPAESRRRAERVRDLQPLTSRTETRIARLKAIVDETRARRYALVDQELEEGLISLAVPMVGASGRTIAAMNVSGQANRTAAGEMQRRFLAPVPGGRPTDLVARRRARMGGRALRAIRDGAATAPPARHNADLVVRSRTFGPPTADEDQVASSVSTSRGRGWSTPSRSASSRRWSSRCRGAGLAAARARRLERRRSTLYLGDDLDHDDPRRRSDVRAIAAQQDENAYVVLTAVSLAAVISLAAIVLELAAVKGVTPRRPLVPHGDHGRDGARIVVPDPDDLRASLRALFYLTDAGQPAPLIFPEKGLGRTTGTSCISRSRSRSRRRPPRSRRSALDAQGVARAVGAVVLLQRQHPRAVDQHLGRPRVGMTGDDVRSETRARPSREQA